MTTPKPPVPSEAELREMRRQAVAYYWADGHFADWVETGEVTDRPDTWDKDLEPLYELLQKQWLAGYHARDAERDANWNAENWDLKNLLLNENKLYREASELAEARKSRIAELEAKAERLKSVAELSERLHSRASEALAKFMQSRYDRGLDPEANCGDYHGDVAVKVIQRLEAEVAELRKQADRDEDDADQLWEILGKFAGSAESLKTAARRAVAEADAAPRRTPELTERVADAIEKCPAQHAQGLWSLVAAEAALDVVFGKKEEE